MKTAKDGATAWIDPASVDVIPPNRHQARDSSPFSCSAVLEAAGHETKTQKAKRQKAQSETGPSGSGSFQGRRHWQPSVPGIAARLYACHRRIHRMVLFGTAPLV